MVILHEPIRGDVHKKKPIRQLNAFLKHIGLELTLAKVEKIAGRKIRYYAISADLLATMTRLALSYRGVRARLAEEKEIAPRRRSNRAEQKIAEPTPGGGKSPPVPVHPRCPETTPAVQGTIDSGHH